MVAAKGGPESPGVDQDLVETGDPWPERLSEAHARSKIFVVVLSANYFKSGWCTSEWRNAVDRFKSLKRVNADQLPLIFPLRYNDFKDEDVDKLPRPMSDEVRLLQIGIDF